MRLILLTDTLCWNCVEEILRAWTSVLLSDSLLTLNQAETKRNANSQKPQLTAVCLDLESLKQAPSNAELTEY